MSTLYDIFVNVRIVLNRRFVSEINIFVENFRKHVLCLFGIK